MYNSLIYASLAFLGRDLGRVMPAHVVKGSQRSLAISE